MSCREHFPSLSSEGYEEGTAWPKIQSFRTGGKDVLARFVRRSSSPSGSLSNRGSSSQPHPRWTAPNLGQDPVSPLAAQPLWQQAILPPRHSWPATAADRAPYPYTAVRPAVEPASRAAFTPVPVLRQGA